MMKREDTSPAQQNLRYREFFDGPSRGQWRRAQIGQIQDDDGKHTEVKVVPFTTLYSGELAVVNGGNECFQHFNIQRKSWVRNLRTGKRDIVDNDRISWEDKVA